MVGVIITEDNIPSSLFCCTKICNLFIQAWKIETTSRTMLRGVGFNRMCSELTSTMSHLHATCCSCSAVQCSAQFCTWYVPCPGLVKIHPNSTIYWMPYIVLDVVCLEMWHKIFSSLWRCKLPFEWFSDDLYQKSLKRFKWVF